MTFSPDATPAPATAPVPRRRVLVLGATGFIGSLVTEQLIAAGHEVIALKRASSSAWRVECVSPYLHWLDVDSPELVSAFDAGIFAIVHAATAYGRAGESDGQIESTNVTLPLRLLDLAIPQHVARFINIDTFFPPGYAVLGAYAQSKAKFKTLALQRCSGLRFINLLPSHLYGPRDDERKVIPSLILQLLRREPHIDLTPGLQRRSFLLGADFAELCVRVATGDCPVLRGNGFVEFPAWTGQTHTMRHLVETLAQLTGADAASLHFGALPYRANEMMDQAFDDTTTQRDLRWSARTSLDAGLRLTVDWYRHRLGATCPAK